MKKQFKDLNIDDQFILNNNTYKKIADIKVSCCRKLNACLVEDTNQRIQVKPLDEVELKNE
jgi:hypothetical protein